MFLDETELSLQDGANIGMNIFGSVIGIMISTWTLTFSFILMYKSEIKQYKFLKLLKIMTKIGKNKRRRVNFGPEKSQKDLDGDDTAGSTLSSAGYISSPDESNNG
jgi:hypothetical protein